MVVVRSFLVVSQDCPCCGWEFRDGRPRFGGAVLGFLGSARVAPSSRRRDTFGLDDDGDGEDDTFWGRQPVVP